MQKALENYEIVTTKQKEKWNKIVRSFKSWEVFYLAEYVMSFEIENKEVGLLFYYNDGTTRAINVFVKRDIAKNEKFKGKIIENKYFDISSQYGYGGLIIEGDADKVNTAFQKYCAENNIITEIVRFGLFNENRYNYYGEIQAVKPNIVRKINLSPEEMLMDFEHKVRKNLKRANANNLQIEIDTDGKRLNQFMEIYYNTMNRNKAKSEYYFSKQFFEMLCSMKENVVIFNVLLGNKVISTELVLYGNGNCYSFLGGTLNEYFGVRPNDFIKYEIIKWAYKNGINNFILGGGYTNSLEDGIFKYKKSFAPKESKMDFYIGKKIFNEGMYKELVGLRNDITNEEFFPLYRG